MARPLYYRNALKQSRVVKQDGGSVTHLPDGSILWLFGETTVECDTCPGGVITLSSSALIADYKEPHHPHARFLVDTNGVPRPVIQVHEPATNLHLGGCAIVNDCVFIHWEKLSDNGKFLASGSGYQPHAHNLTAINVTEANLKAEKSYVTYSLVKDGFLYHFTLFSGKLLLGRRSVTDISDNDQATDYWDGKEFRQIDIKEAIPIINHWQRDQVTVSWNEYLRRYVMLSTSDPIEMHVSENLWGPYENPVEVFRVPEELKQGGRVTNVQFHPELWREDGKIMSFSYSITDGQGDGLPYFVETSLVRKQMFIPVA